MVNISDLVRPGTLSNPHAVYHRLRAANPVQRSDAIGGWIVTGYADVAAALCNPRLSVLPIIDQLQQRIDASLTDETRPLGRTIVTGLRLLHADPLRRPWLPEAVSRSLLPRSVEWMRPRIRQIVDGLLDEVLAAGQCDAVHDFAAPLASSVITNLVLSLPTERSAAAAQQLADLLAFLGTVRPGALRDEREQRARHAYSELTDLLSGLIVERRRRPGEDLISALAASEAQDSELTAGELLAIALIIYDGGTVNVQSFVGNALLTLLEHPDLICRLQEQPSLMGRAVDELLRFSGPVHLMARQAVEDVTVGDQSIRQGQRVVLAVAAANRDRARFAQPDRLDIGRRDNRHLAFGAGAHYCKGASLARLEVRIALEAVLCRLPGLRASTMAPAWSRMPMRRGLTALPIHFDTRTA